MTSGRVGWFRWNEAPAASQLEHPLCEAERHEGAGIRATYILAMSGTVVEEYYYMPLVMGICDECLSIIAADVGTTPELGALTL